MHLVSDLKVPEPCPDNDIVDCKEFWTKVEYDMLARGLCEGNLTEVWEH